MIDTRGGVTSASDQAPEQSGSRFFDKLFTAAQAGAVFSPPVVSGAYTVVTACEVFAVGAFGSGGGSAPASTSESRSANGSQAETASGSGRGGLGLSRGRPVAAIIIGPDGVKVQPIVDATKVAVTALAVWGSVALMAVRLARGRRMRGFGRRAAL